MLLFCETTAIGFTYFWFYFILKLCDLFEKNVERDAILTLFDSSRRVSTCTTCEVFHRHQCWIEVHTSYLRLAEIVFLLRIQSVNNVITVIYTSSLYNRYTVNIQNEIDFYLVSPLPS